MTFPHYVNMIPAVMKTIIVKVKEFDKFNQPIMVDKEQRVLSSGIIDIVQDPAAPITQGENVLAVWQAYRIESIEETRPARGDWSFTDIQPEWIRCRVIAI